ILAPSAAFTSPAGKVNKLPCALASAIVWRIVWLFFRSAEMACLQSVLTSSHGVVKILKPEVQEAKFAPKAGRALASLLLALKPRPKAGELSSVRKRVSENTPVWRVKVLVSPWLTNASQVQSVSGIAPRRPASRL